jgi:DNA-binding cell septation regulator SpoVG
VTAPDQKAREQIPPESNRCRGCGKFCGERWEATGEEHLSKRPDSLYCPECTALLTTITVREIRRLAGAGTMKGFATVEVAPWTIRGCRIIQQPGQQPYVAMPQETSAEGRYFPVIATHDKRLKAILQAAVLSAWDNRGHDHDEAD